MSQRDRLTKNKRERGRCHTTALGSIAQLAEETVFDNAEVSQIAALETDHQLFTVHQRALVAPVSEMQSNRRFQRHIASLQQGPSRGESNVVQRGPLDPTNLAAWSWLKSAHHRREWPDVYRETLSAATGAGLAMLNQMIETGRPETDQEHELFEYRAKRLVRLTALGLMASHRATIEHSRDENLGTAVEPPEGGEERRASSCQKAQEVRSAARGLQELQRLREELKSYRLDLGGLKARALHSGLFGSSLDSLLKGIYDNSEAYRTNEITEYLRMASTRLLSTNSERVRRLLIRGIAERLEKWREAQIAGVNESIQYVYRAYPFFSQLDPEDVCTSDHATDVRLLQAVRAAYTALMEKIDDAIAIIGSGDIHPFEITRAVEVAGRDLPAELQHELDRLVERHKVSQFWLRIGTLLGLTVWEAAVILCPLIGAPIFAAAALASTTADLESMLDRQALAGASVSPEGELLGVHEPSVFEWMVFGVSQVLTARGLGGAWPNFRTRTHAAR